MSFVDLNIQLPDLSDVDAWGGGNRPLVPPGLYLLELIEAESSSSKSTNQPTLKTTFRVLSDGDAHGMELQKSYSLQGDKWVRARLKSFLQAIQHPLDQPITGAIVGSRMFAEVTQKPLPKRDTDPPDAEVKYINEISNEQAEEAMEAAPPPPPQQAAAPAPSRRAVSRTNGAAAQKTR